jgi:mannose/fructose/N-acetylgalactosamine-specific phosphotransferase system component IID
MKKKLWGVIIFCMCVVPCGCGFVWKWLTVGFQVGVDYAQDLAKHIDSL